MCDKKAKRDLSHLVVKTKVHFLERPANVLKDILVS